MAVVSGNMKWNWALRNRNTYLNTLRSGEFQYEKKERERRWVHNDVEENERSRLMAPSVINLTIF